MLAYKIYMTSESNGYIRLFRRRMWTKYKMDTQEFMTSQTPTHLPGYQKYETVKFKNLSLRRQTPKGPTEFGEEERRNRSQFFTHELT